MNKDLKIAAVIPAAGVGSRMQLSYPKQYLKIAEKTVLQHTQEKLSQLNYLSHLAIAVSADDPYFATLNLQDERIVKVIGGETRADSVLNALRALQADAPDWVLVHDAARPLVTVADIDNLVQSCLAADEGGILAAKVKDTIKRGTSHIETTVPRDTLWQALTPQFFRFNELLQALTDAKQAGSEITDEASAMERLGYPVRLVAGRSDNIKITSPEDYELACFLLTKTGKV
ncbi:2-C-methyl-D-erythritol 4-phosphate cytidylyltransferase [Pseudoalteromonas fenneropenaei]|uniref:2-C-methyl-D-erythritol 4-phosphate cytidylyltransferase n=1 Tax=Pseudoalteromonas fenneropenaei TaxID=1737459 RepID=A0ABV7CNW6_9GAMM